MAKVVRENLVQPNDKVIVTYIYAHPVSISNVDSYVYNPPVISSQAKTPDQRKRALKALQPSVERYKDSVVAVIVNNAFARKPDLMGSGIIEMIPQLQSLSEDTAHYQYEALFISDMIQETKLSNLRLNPVKGGHRQSVKRAGADFAKVCEAYGVSKNCLLHLRAVHIVPQVHVFDEMQPECLHSYWKEVLRLCGTKAVFTDADYSQTTVRR